jgi:metal-responsive CopG/Arc/MetJ family transcriptional regulator
MNNQKILISLPLSLIKAIDVVKSERRISRSAFVRESLLRNLHYYEKYERGRVGVQLDDPEFDCGRTL